MGNKGWSSRLWFEIGFAVSIIAGSLALLGNAISLPTMSALLPVTMLVCLIILAATLIATQYLRRESLPEDLEIGQPWRVLGAFAALMLYVLAVQYIGFYTSTIMMIPIVAWSFGYRSLRGLALATAIFIGGIYLIFSIFMGQRFPEELLMSWG
ncbi:tripartite tricarboxylate transporter TctB family protein [Thalassorhabdomicrobium marinisediminis]|uniref:DUF1468 domain-containing protein n=1 Tax=Thalassorhabdomicrobium marinisediminis TaxID=2170577 RepID=A0A2T7FZD1_9RHOB|nr:tripartite tricarboxylate transporter TctB family protein [Thalassorhabdomicrobium marinisediminis]PVA07519.1 hypothetical protein DC363_02480 [Thalassorhabdomicrobium marinisediminis]